MSEELVEHLENLKIFQLKSEKAKKDIDFFKQALEQNGYYENVYALLNVLRAKDESNYFISANVNQQFLTQVQKQLDIYLKEYVENQALKRLYYTRYDLLRKSITPIVSIL